MKCLIKHKNLLFEVYWIKHKKNQVIGNFCGCYQDRILGFPVETHFTYPRDGKIHYSHKSYEKECYITASHDKIKVKQLIKGQFQTNYIAGKTILNHLLPDPELQLPLSHYNSPGTFYHFATTAFSVPITDDAAILQHCRSQTEQPAKEDLVIPTDSLDPGTLNILAFIASQDYPQQALNNAKYWQTVDKTKTPMIGISATHISNTY